MSGWKRWRRAGNGGLFARGGEDVVPVVSWGTQALDRRMTAHHLATGRFACFVGVEAAIDPVPACQERAQPRHVGTDSRCRDEQARRLPTGFPEPGRLAAGRRLGSRHIPRVTHVRGRAGIFSWFYPDHCSSAHTTDPPPNRHLAHILCADGHVSLSYHEHPTGKKEPAVTNPDSKTSPNYFSSK